MQAQTVNTSGPIYESSILTEDSLGRSSLTRKTSVKRAPDLISDYLWRFEEPLSRSGKSRNLKNKILSGYTGSGSDTKPSLQGKIRSYLDSKSLKPRESQRDSSVFGLFIERSIDSYVSLQSSTKMLRQTPQTKSHAQFIKLNTSNRGIRQIGNYSEILKKFGLAFEEHEENRQNMK